MDRKPIRLIHVTNSRNRLAIFRWGLRARYPRDHNYKGDGKCLHQPQGVYGKEVSSRPWEGHSVYRDVWKIDCSGLPRKLDPLISRGWMILCDVPPDRLTLVKQRI